MDRMHALLYIHLPDKTLVYDHAASLDIGTPIWTVQTSGANGDQAYRARGFAGLRQVAVRRQTRACASATSAPATRGSSAKRCLGSSILCLRTTRAAARSRHSLELVRPPGRETLEPVPPATVETGIAVSWSDDGIIYRSRASAVALRGERAARATGRQLGWMSHYRSFRFRGMNNPYPTPSPA